MDSHDPEDVPTHRERLLAAVKFMGLERPEAVQEPELTWRDRIRALLFRATARSGAARPHE